MRMSTAPIPLRVILFILIIPFIAASILVLIYTNTFRLSDFIKNDNEVLIINYYNSLFFYNINLKFFFSVQL